MRPILHFTSPHHWLNDPNGLIYHEGYYHIFYQHFPYANHWGTMHWGHATTKDFIHFHHHPIALYPSKDYDQNGCFSGSSLFFKNQLHLYYTAIKYNSLNKENIHIRNSEQDTTAKQAVLISQDGFHFDNVVDKHLILDNYPQDRDPKAWIGQDGNVYLMIGSSINGQGGLHFYKSKDGISFEYVNHYAAPIGDMWECPNIISLNNQDYLIICPENIDVPPKPNCNAVILPIHFDKSTCTITKIGNYQYLDYGLDFYAPQTFQDETDQTTLLAWLRMRQPFANENWVGMLCMPRIIYEKNGILYQDVHPLLKNRFTSTNQPVTMNQPFCLSLSLKEKETVLLGGFQITYQDDCLILNRNQVSIVHKKVCNLTQSPPLNHRCDLDIYYDYGVFEIFINQGQYVMSQIVYNLDQTIVLPHQNYTYSLYNKTVQS